MQSKNEGGDTIPALPFTQRIFWLSIFRAGLGAGITNGYYFDTFLKWRL
jgi:hypothetical protein